MPGIQPTILVIDNDEGFATALTARLTHCGYECLTAATGAQGISICAERPVDLVITDLNMPMGNGVDLARTLRKSSDVPIIVVTGFRDEFRRELRSIRNVTTLVKPIDQNQLIDLIDTELILSGRTVP